MMTFASDRTDACPVVVDQISRDTGSSAAAQALDDGPPAAVPERSVTTASDCCSKARVLIVDDAHDVADTLQALLATVGYDVATAYDGESAVRSAAIFKPEVILCDIDLPGAMNGYDVARCLRARLDAPLLVAVTGFGRPQDIREAREAGFDAHLLKPMSLTQFEHLLSQHRRSKLR
jgi:CheY-like chemotaxis protein